MTDKSARTFVLTVEAVEDLLEAGVVGPVDTLTIYGVVEDRGTGLKVAPVTPVEGVLDMSRAIDVFADDLREVG